MHTRRNTSPADRITALRHLIYTAEQRLYVHGPVGTSLDKRLAQEMIDVWKAELAQLTTQETPHGV